MRNMQKCGAEECPLMLFIPSCRVYLKIGNPRSYYWAFVSVKLASGKTIGVSWFLAWLQVFAMIVSSGFHQQFLCHLSLLTSICQNPTWCVVYLTLELFLGYKLLHIKDMECTYNINHHYELRTYYYVYITVYIYSILVGICFSWVGPHVKIHSILQVPTLFRWVVELVERESRRHWVAFGMAGMGAIRQQLRIIGLVQEKRHPHISWEYPRFPVDFPKKRNPLRGSQWWMADRQGFIFRTYQVGWSSKYYCLVVCHLKIKYFSYLRAWNNDFHSNQGSNMLEATKQCRTVAPHRPSPYTTWFSKIQWGERESSSTNSGSINPTLSISKSLGNL